MKERNLWKIIYIAEAPFSSVEHELSISTKTDHAPEAEEIAKEIIEGLIGEEWSFAGFKEFKSAGLVFSAKGK